MPQVPVFEQQTQFQNQNFQTPRAPEAVPGAFPTSTGQAIEGLGKGVEQAGDHVANMVIQQKQRADEKQVVDAATDAQQKIQDTLNAPQGDGSAGASGASSIVDAITGGGPVSSTPDSSSTDFSTANAAANSDTQGGLLNRKLDNAAGITSQFDEAYQKIQNDALDQVSTPQQKATLGHMLSSYGVAAREQVIRHESDQTNQAYAVSASAKTQADVIAAAGIQDPDLLIPAIENAQAVQAQMSKRMGLDPTSLQINHDKLADDMTNAAFGPLLVSNPQRAQALLDATRDKLSPNAAANMQGQLNAKLFDDKVDAIWNGVRGMTLSNGTPDVEGMIDRATKDASLNPTQRDKVYDVIQARGKALVQQVNQQSAADDYSARNDAQKLFNQKVPLDQAIKQIVGHYGDPADAAGNADLQKTVETLYAPPATTDPATFNQLKAGINSSDRPLGTADVDQAFSAGKLSPSSYMQLTSEVHAAQNKDVAQQRSLMMERIKEQATGLISNKDDREKYLFQVGTQSQGMNPSDTWKLSQDLLKQDPSAGRHGFFWLKTTPQYMTDDSAMKARAQVGDDQVLAIGAGTGKAQPGIADVDSFAKAMGGYDKIEKGTPTNNAIISLQNRGKAVTPDAVSKVLSHFKDGVWK